MIFNGVDLDTHFKIKSISGRGISSYDLQLQETVGSDGALFQRKRRGSRIINVKFDIRGVSASDLRTRIDTLNGILNVDAPVSIIFDDEPTITYYGVPEVSGDGEDVRFVYKGELNIICPDPDKYGTQRNLSFANDVLALTNVGSTIAKPVITMTFPTVVTKTDDFTGKIQGSTVVNPHYSRHYYNAALQIPNVAGSDSTTAHYTSISTLNASYYTPSVTVNTQIAQVIFSFNLIEHIKRKWNYTVPGATVAEQVTWLKANVNRLIFNHHGFGSGVGGSKVTLTIWQASSSAWTTSTNHVNAVVAKITITSATPSNFIDATGFAHYIAYANMSDGVTPSVLNTDLVNIDVEMKNNFTTSLTVTNQDGKFVKVNRVFIGADVVVLDFKARKLTINGVTSMPALDWMGSEFFPLKKGANNLSISPVGIVTATLVYKDVWL